MSSLPVLPLPLQLGAAVRFAAAAVGLAAIAQWAAVQPALNEPSPLPQGLGTGGLFVNNIPSNMSVGAGTLAVTSNDERDETRWRLALRDAVRHNPGCGCGANHGTS